MDGIEDRLRELGIDPGQWQEMKINRPESLTEIQSLLEKLRDTLQFQVNEDIGTLAHLREAQNRSRFGGGK